MTRDEQLAAQGWQRQATYDDPRLSEMTALYEEIGLEVHLEPFQPETPESCSGCMTAFPERYRTIYTRKANRPEKREESP